MAEGLGTQEIPAIRVRDFGSWMAAEQRRIFLLCYRLLQDRDEADTATQDTFMKAYRALNSSSAPDLEDRNKWLTRIAVNTCLDRIRSQAWKFWKRRSRREDEEIILALTAAPGPTAEDRIFAQQIAKRLAAAIAGLSPRQRSVFLLKHYENRRLEEIAEILKLEVGTVKAHMARAVARLKEELVDLYGISKNTRQRLREER